MHCSDAAEDERILECTDARWETVRKYSAEWAVLDGRERERAEELMKRNDRSLDDGSWIPRVMLHVFTHKQRVEQAKRQAASGKTGGKNIPFKKEDKVTCSR